MHSWIFSLIWTDMHSREIIHIGRVSANKREISPRAGNRINNNFHFLKRARIHQARTENGFLGNATIVFFSKLRLIFYTIFFLLHRFSSFARRFCGHIEKHLWMEARFSLFTKTRGAESGPFPRRRKYCMVVAKKMKKI